MLIFIFKYSTNSPEAHSKNLNNILLADYEILFCILKKNLLGNINVFSCFEVIFMAGWNLKFGGDKKFGNLKYNN